GIVYGYEEALGYCVDPGTVRDKDGISAALLFAAYASRMRAQGRTVPDELARIRATDGVFRTQPLTFRLEDTALIGEAMAALRAAPPTELGGSPVTEVVDMTEGYGGLAPTDGLVLLTRAGDRAIVRPSGTEPKLKCYLEAVEDVERVDPEDAAKDPARADPHVLVGPAWDAAGDRLTRMAADLRGFFRL